jgi:hypothetical protein
MAFFSSSPDLVRFALATNGGKFPQPVTVQSDVHDGEMLGGRVMSLVTLRERGIVVAVVSNISHTDTSTLAMKVAEAFTRTQTAPR